jgi:hypothetical protein
LASPDVKRHGGDETISCETPQGETVRPSEGIHGDKAANNPLSSVYGGRMVHVPECAAWTWDARPYPFFPALSDVWTDGGNWRLGHWLTGRLGAVSLAALVCHLCLRAGLPESRIDVTGLWGAVEGYAITALEGARPLARVPRFWSRRGPMPAGLWISSTTSSLAGGGFVS